jgi:predicted HAD superfamily phosphohydrolase
MNSDAVFTLLAIAVAVSSLALAATALLAVGVYRAVRRLERDVAPLIPQVTQTMQIAQQTLTDTVTQVRELSVKAHNVLDATQTQLNALDEARTEISTRFRIQAERAELVLDDTLSRLQEVVGVIHSGVMRPVREVTGILAGIRTAFQTFLQNRRPSVAQATQDEEMFI